MIIIAVGIDREWCASCSSSVWRKQKLQVVLQLQVFKILILFGMGDWLQTGLYKCGSFIYRPINIISSQVERSNVYIIFPPNGLLPCYFHLQSLARAIQCIRIDGKSSKLHIKNPIRITSNTHIKAYSADMNITIMYHQVQPEVPAPATIHGFKITCMITNASYSWMVRNYLRRYKNHECVTSYTESRKEVISKF